MKKAILTLMLIFLLPIFVRADKPLPPVFYFPLNYSFYSPLLISQTYKTNTANSAFYPASLPSQSAHSNIFAVYFSGDWFSYAFESNYKTDLLESNRIYRFLPNQTVFPVGAQLLWLLFNGYTLNEIANTVNTTPFDKIIVFYDYSYHTFNKTLQLTNKEDFNTEFPQLMLKSAFSSKIYEAKEVNKVLTGNPIIDRVLLTILNITVLSITSVPETVNSITLLSNKYFGTSFPHFNNFLITENEIQAPYGVTYLQQNFYFSPSSTKVIYDCQGALYSDAKSMHDCVLRAIGDQEFNLFLSETLPEIIFLTILAYIVLSFNGGIDV